MILMMVGGGNFTQRIKVMGNRFSLNAKYKKINEIKKDILTIDRSKKSMSEFYELTKDYYEEGIEKGMKQGRQEGRQEGILNTLISLAKKLNLV